MAGDLNPNWIVSTAAGLFQHHRDNLIVATKLTALIMQAHGAQGEENEQTAYPRKPPNPTHKRLNAVMMKIVSSVWFNVVNVGCDTIPLPQELLDLCPRGHYLEPGDFGIVINAIRARCQSKAVLRTDHLLRDVLTWILLHYDGTIVVNVSGQIVYRADLGNRQRELEVHVMSACRRAPKRAAVTKPDNRRCTRSFTTFRAALRGSCPEIPSRNSGTYSHGPGSGSSCTTFLGHILPTAPCGTRSCRFE